MTTQPTVFKSAPAVAMATEAPLITTSPEQSAKGQEWESWSPLTMQDVRCKEWNKDEIVVQELPMFFPSTNLNYEFKGSELGTVLSRVTSLLRKLSIQADLRHSPLSAYLQTVENVEFYLVFFHERSSRRRATAADPSSRIMYMSVQRHKGDQIIANQYINQIVEAAKGVGIEMETEPGQRKRMLSSHQIHPDPAQLLAVERLIERSIHSQPERVVAAADDAQPSSVFPKSPSNEEMTRSAVETLHAWTQNPKRLDNRRHFLEYLMVMTDVRRTLSSSAISAAFMVLRGTVPGMEREASEIQAFLLTMLQNRALPGDEDMFEGFPVAPESDNDMEIKPYFPEETELPHAYPPFFVEYLNELFHLALQVLVQSLEVVACFHEKITEDGHDIQEMATELFARASDVSNGKDVYMTLLGCVQRVQSKLSNGYLACKALRLLALASPALKERLKADANARTCINNAYRIGQESHTLLKEESFQLWEAVRQ